MAPILNKWLPTDTGNFIAVILLLFVIVSSVGCETLPASGLIWGIEITKSEPFEINVDDKMGWGHYAFGILQEYEDDLIVLHYCTEGDNAIGPFITVDEKGNYLPGHQRGRGPALSRDRGKTWEIARPSFPGLGIPGLASAYIGTLNVPNPAYFHSMFNYPDGRKLVFSPVIMPGGGQSEYCGVGSFIRRRADGIWEGPFNAFFDARGPQDEPLETMLHLAPRGVVCEDGSLITVGYTNWKDKYNKRSHGNVTIAFRSVDDGQTFHRLSIIATEDHAPWGNEGPCEPCIARMPNGDLLCIMRTGMVGLPGYKQHFVGLPLLSARSRDEGLTWHHSKLRMSGVMPKLLVMKNNLVVLATGRPGNSLVFSRDSGKHWPLEISITRADLSTSGYIDLLEVEPGRLLIVFDVFDSPRNSIWLWEPEYVNGIMGMFMDVRVR